MVLGCVCMYGVAVAYALRFFFAAVAAVGRLSLKFERNMSIVTLQQQEQQQQQNRQLTVRVWRELVAITFFTLSCW